MSSPARLGDVQLAIMQVLWTRAEATVADVHADLWDSRALAPTTVATMLKKMEARGLVGHRAEGRKFIYRPLLSESEVRRSMVADLTRRLFGGSPSSLVSHLLSEHEIEQGELEELGRLVADAENEEPKR